MIINKIFLNSIIINDKFRVLCYNYKKHVLELITSTSVCVLNLLVGKKWGKVVKVIS